MMGVHCWKENKINLNGCQLPCGNHEKGNYTYFKIIHANLNQRDLSESVSKQFLYLEKLMIPFLHCSQLCVA